jgi:hypothetical protein
MPDESDELAKIDKWLSSTGFPLEYAAARTLTSIGYIADAGLYYRPTDGGPPREVDIVCRTGGTFDEHPVDVRLVLECKYASTPGSF